MHWESEKLLKFPLKKDNHCYKGRITVLIWSISFNY
jgi:hypothetical protein